MGINHAICSTTRLTICAAALSMLAGTQADAHDDDVRKILDKLPAVFGPVWTQGMATQRGGGFDSENITLLSHIPLNNFSGVDSTEGNDCWGYISPSGKEYAIMGLMGGFGFVDISDPTNPVIVDTVTGPISMWHDVKVLGEYAYGVSEGGAGIQVMDLSDIDSGNVTLVTNWQSGGYSTTHNIVVNEEAGTLWLAGANVGNGGLLHVDISNPASPSFDGGWTEMYVHDAQVVTWHDGEFDGRELAFVAGGFSGGFQETGLRIVDVSNPNNPTTLSTLFYPNAGYAHQVWLSTDRKYLYLNDELDEGATVSVTTTRIINVEDPANPFLEGTYTTGKEAVDHNLYTRDHVVYQANYRSGLRVFDAIDPANPVEVAYFDTFPGSDSPSFNGAWSSYPFFPSGNIIVSDIERGLFVMRVDAPLIPMALESAGDDSATLKPDGSDTLSVKTVTRESTEISTVELMLNTGSGFSPIAMSDNGDGTYSAAVPVLDCDSNVSYYFSAQTSDGFSTSYPADGLSAALSAKVVSDTIEEFADNFQTNLGWTVSGSVNDGAWERAVPAGNGDRGDPGTDFDGSGRCYLTANRAGNSDVDDGTTILTSPAMDASSGNSTLTYALWYSNNIGEVDDSMQVQLSNNNGNSWTTIDTLGPASVDGGWNEYTFDTNSIFASPSDQMRVRFVVGDTGEGSVVEAAVDAVRLIEQVCEDVNLDCNAADLADPRGTLDFFDVSVFLDLFGASDPAADLTDDGQFDFFDVSAFLDFFGAGCP